MKKIFTVSAALLSAVMMISCNKENNPEEKPGTGGETGTVELVTPVLSAVQDGVVSLDEESDAVVLNLSWTDALPQGQTLGLSYTVYCNDAAADLYSSPLTFNAGKSLGLGLKASDILDLVKKVGTETAELQFVVYAKPSDENIEAKTSNVLKLKFALVSHKLELPAKLYLFGSATIAGWDPAKAIAVTGIDGIYTTESVELNFVPSDTGFKYLFSNDGSDNRFFGPDPAVETFGAVKLYTEDVGINLFQPALNGYKSGVYTIVLDLNSYRMSMTRTGDIEHKLDLGDNVYPLGDCFKWGWEFTNPMSKVSENVYEIKAVHMNFGDGNNGFKIFTAEGKWSPYFAMTDDSVKDNIKILTVTDSEAPQFKPGLIGYESGNYDIRADFGAMTLTLTLISKDEKPDFDETKAFYLFGGGFENGVKDWEFDVKNALVETPEGSGIYVSPGTIYLNRWCYFKLDKQDWTEYRRDASASDYWTAISSKNTEADDTFSPGNGFSDWTDGNYKVTFDTNTLKLSLVKSE